jgi:hypothetical protein
MLVAQIQAAQKKSEEAPQTSPKVEDAGLQRCPCCNWDLHNRNQPIPNEDERKEYVRCLLGKRRFAKTYTMFDGAVTARFEVLSPEQATALGGFLAKLSREDQLTLTTNAISLKLLFYLRMFNETRFVPPAADSDWEKEFQTRFQEYGEDVPILLTRVLMEFIRLVERLPTAGFDKGFWKGAGLG